MPSSITHELVASSAKKLLPPEIAAMADAAPDYFYLGAQGPDLLFFYRPLSRREFNFGRLLHRERIYDLFCAFSLTLRGMTGEDFERSRAYVLGYIAHCCADAVFHPFVYRYLDELHAGKFEHQQIENDWDVYFLTRMRGQGAERYTFPFSLNTISREGTLFSLWNCVAHTLGRRDLSPAAFRTALKNFGRYLRFFHRRCYSARGRWESFEKFFRFRGLSRLYPRPTPDARVIGGEGFYELAEGSASNADELFRTAAQRSADRISRFAECFSARVPLPRDEFSVHLLTGRKID